MARQIDILSTSTGAHYLLFGFDSNELSSFSIQFWITKYGKRAVDWMQGLSLGFISFMGGDVWVHNSDAVPRVNFFGEQKYSEVGVVMNENANVIKFLDSIGIHSDGQWSVESVTIPKTLNTPSGMLSKIPKGRFKKREGVWQAEFLRNMKSTTSTASVIEAIKGEPLKGYAAYLVLRNTDTAEVKLFKVDFLLTSIRG
jgi:hypothetical protein